MRKTKKKKGKKILIGVIIVVIVIVVIAAILRPRGNKYDEETATIGDITSYYTFSGNVEAINIQNKVSQDSFTVSSISVSEGNTVKKGDTIIKSTYGTKITADQNGVVTKIYVKKDDKVMPGNQLFDIVDYDNLQTTVNINEYDLPSIKSGKKVDVTINALDKTVSGTISEISREATNSNGVAYFTAKIKLAKDSSVKVGMTTEIKVLNQSASDVVLIPMDAVQIDDQNKTYVYVKDEKGNAITQYIETGISDGLNIEVKSGLNEGDIVLKPIVSASPTMSFSGMRNANGGNSTGNSGGNSNGR